MSCGRRRQHAAFTLVEVVIVVAIVAVLAAIAVPQYRKVRERSQRRSCYANLKTIAGALEWYCADVNLPYQLTSDGDFTPLLKGGYLNALPECPTKGKGCYTAAGGKNQAVCSFHGTIKDDAPPAEPPEDDE